MRRTLAGAREIPPSPPLRKGGTKALALVALLAIPTFLVLAEGDDQDPREVALTRIRAQIARLENRLAETRQRETGLEGEVRRTRIELDLQEQQLAEATTAFHLTSAQADAAEAKVGELEIALSHIRQDLQRRLLGLYRLGRQGYLRLFLALEPDQNVLPAIRQLRFLVNRDQVALDRYLATRDELAGERRRLEARRLDMDAWQQREAERRDGLVTLRQRQEDLLERVARQRRDLSAAAKELSEKERKLMRLITSLVSSDAHPLEGTPIGEFRGVLDWPARGKIVGRFGPRLDARYGTEVPHNGIDLALDAEEPEVRSIFPGQVLFASEFEGYGLMVVVHHPGRVFTLYSKLGELSVSKDDVVSLGTMVGLATDQLYFEVRRENQAEDPLLWLR